MRALAIVAGLAAAVHADVDRQWHYSIATVFSPSPVVHGVRLDAAGGFHGVQLGIGAGWERLVATSGLVREGGGGDLYVRLSLFGLVADDHRLEHWFDVGAVLGGGGGVTGSGSAGRISAGAWIDIGLWSGESYPAIELGVSRTDVEGPWRDETLFTVALQWAGRDRGTIRD